MNKPNFFIVGAARSGTTSMWWYLKQHRQVFMPNDELNKEPAFFSDKSSMSLEEYLKLFEAAEEQHKVIGEVSTAYLVDPKSARKIKEFNPEAKILILLRNPADRAYALYNWMVQEGYEYCSSFQKALELEKKRGEKGIPNFWEPEYYWNYMYFRSGLYHEQVSRYVSEFGNNVLILKFYLLKSRFNFAYSRVCDFLGISREEVSSVPQNVSKRVYSPALQFFLRKANNKFQKFQHKVLRKVNTSKESRDKLLRLGLNKKPPAKMSKKLRNELLRKYESDLIKLSELTKIDFSDWFARI